ncbi:hypothetical protein BRADI_3g24746v3 [Brachypodium distachyon]|uniref:Uncharacterized protein n=1 Tax=Brachypodium distachyon TaxID=15368 RepID=A0A0Q3HSR4_BRADI|nr:hypothetical protein BRADI_3g24746v3 [Brachypodium distachyon]
MRHRQRRLGLVAERAHGEQAPIAASSRAIDLLAAVVSTISSVGSYITVAAMRLGQSREVGVSTRRWSLLAPVRRRHQWLSIPHPSGMRSRFVPCARRQHHTPCCHPITKLKQEVLGLSTICGRLRKWP